MTLIAYTRVREAERGQKEDKLSIMEKQFNAMQSQMQPLVSTLSKLTEQGQVNTGSRNTLFFWYFEGRSDVTVAIHGVSQIR